MQQIKVEEIFFFKKSYFLGHPREHVMLLKSVKRVNLHLQSKLHEKPSPMEEKIHGMPIKKCQGKATAKAVAHLPSGET